MQPRHQATFAPPPSFGNYRVRGLLGSGGMASVFEGEHTLLQRPVAIKFMHRDIAASAEARERFVREARVVAKLSHPNIVAMFDFGTLDDGTYYQATELIAGTTLRDRLQAGALPPRDALAYARQIALGLACAHDAGVIHRDLKPSNIMVAPDKAGERIVILDFGIAKLVDGAGSSDDDHLTQTGVMIGTPGFMSPEQIRGDGQIDAATDVYSLGILVYSMVCGRGPWHGQARSRLLELHHSTPPPLPSTIVACGPDIDALVVACLAKAAADRPRIAQVIALIDAALATAPEIAAMLDPRTAAVASTAPASETPSSGELTTIAEPPVAGVSIDAPRRTWSRPLVIAGGGVGALAVIAVVLLWAAPWASDDPAAPTAIAPTAIAPAPVAPAPALSPSPPVAPVPVVQDPGPAVPPPPPPPEPSRPASASPPPRKHVRSPARSQGSATRPADDDRRFEKVLK